LTKMMFPRVLVPSTIFLAAKRSPSSKPPLSSNA
jgi:hypothetical protein